MHYQKQFLNDMVCLISWKILLLELVYSNQDGMTFSAYKPVQIFLKTVTEILLSYATENREMLSARSFTVDNKSSHRSLM